MLKIYHRHRVANLLFINNKRAKQEWSIVFKYSHDISNVSRSSNIWISFRYDYTGEKEKAKLDLQLANSGCLGWGEDNNVAQLGDVSGCHGDDADDVRLLW